MIFASAQDYKSRKDVVKAYPSAAKIVKVAGGWNVFEFRNEYDAWKRQK